MSETPNSPELVKEGERVYRAFVAESLRLEALGGVTSAPASYRAVVMEPLLTYLEAYLQRIKSSGTTAVGIEKATVRVISHPDPSAQDGALVAVVGCVDARQVLYSKKGKTQPGVLVRETAWLKRDRDGKLKIFALEGKAVASCEG